MGNSGYSSSEVTARERSAANAELVRLQAEYNQRLRELWRRHEEAFQKLVHSRQQQREHFQESDLLMHVMEEQLLHDVQELTLMQHDNLEALREEHDIVQVILEESLKDHATIEVFEQQQVNIFEQFHSQVERIPDKFRTSKPSVAVVGQSGVGKSMLISALVGRFVTKTGVVDTTVEMYKVYDSEAIEFWDVPGESEERSYRNLQTIVNIKQMHLILIVYVHRCEHVIHLENLIRSCKMPYIVVRNKIDLVTLDDVLSMGLQSREVCLRQAWETEKEKMEGNLLYVSAKTGEGLPDLEKLALQMGYNVSLE